MTFLLILFLFCGAAGHAATPRSYPAAPDALIFAQTFTDRATDAELACGNYRAENRTGTLAFAEGRRNFALRCGENGGGLAYPARGNISFARSGTLLLWIRPAEWDKTANAPRALFWQIPTARGLLSLQIAGTPRHLCACRRPLELVLSDHGGGVTGLWQLAAPAGAGHRCGGFQLIALAWRGRSVFLSWNGAPFKEFDMPEPLADEELPGTLFTLGSSRSWRYDLDECYIYGRKLTDAELRQAFEQGNRIQP